MIPIVWTSYLKSKQDTVINGADIEITFEKSSQAKFWCWIDVSFNKYPIYIIYYIEVFFF